MAIETLAGFGDHELARGPLQQANAQPVLELRDALAQARFGNTDRAAGGGETAVLDHGREEVQIIEIRQGSIGGGHVVLHDERCVRIAPSYRSGRSCLSFAGRRAKRLQSETTMKLLRIDSSVLGENSASRSLTAAIVTRLRAEHPGIEVTHRDLAAQTLPHFTPVLKEGHPCVARNAEVLDEFLAADIVVIGAPMYNFTIPTQLKAWIDRILTAGKTFRYTANGPEGLAGGKRVIVASSRGGFYGEGTADAAMDFQENYLRAVLGFLGIRDVEFVRAEGVAISAEHKEKALATAREAIGTLWPKAA